MEISCACQCGRSSEAVDRRTRVFADRIGAQRVAVEFDPIVKCSLANVFPDRQHRLGRGISKSEKDPDPEWDGADHRNQSSHEHRTLQHKLVSVG